MNKTVQIIYSIWVVMCTGLLTVFAMANIDLARAQYVSEAVQHTVLPNVFLFAGFLIATACLYLFWSKSRRLSAAIILIINAGLSIILLALSYVLPL